MSAFGVVQRHTSNATNKIRHVSLCPTMDLIAVLSEASISIYRTMTWKLILVKNDTELIEALSNTLNIKSVPVCLMTTKSSVSTIKPHFIQFSPSGKLLAIGCLQNILMVMDVETGNCFHSIDFDVFPMAVPVDIQYYDLSWCTIDMNEFDHIPDQLINCYGMAPVELDTKSVAQGIIELLLRESCLICSLCQYTIIGSVFGIYPLFHLDMTNVGIGRNIEWKIVQGGIIKHDCGFGNIYVCYSNSDPDTDMGMRVVSMEQILVGNYSHKRRVSDPTSTTVRTITPALVEINAAHALIQTHVESHNILELLLTNSRKWKDAVKVVLLKLNLLGSVLKGYDMHMGPIKFYYSVIMCGHWHPSVTTTFSSHWNNAGLARLLTGIDVSSNTLIKEISFRFLPLVTNMLLRLKVIKHSYIKARLTTEAVAVGNIMSQMEVLLYKIDETLQEAHRARDRFILYIQFIKQYTNDADIPASSPSGEVPSFVPDLSLRAKFLEMFDPRAIRHDATVDLSLTPQAEVITGTFLFAYLQEQNLPECVWRKYQWLPHGTRLEDGSVKPSVDSASALLNNMMQASVHMCRPLVDVNESESNERSLVGQVIHVKTCVEQLMLSNYTKYSSTIPTPGAWSGSNMNSNVMNSTSTNSVATYPNSISEMVEECDAEAMHPPLPSLTSRWVEHVYIDEQYFRQHMGSNASANSNTATPNHITLCVRHGVERADDGEMVLCGGEVETTETYECKLTNALICLGLNHSKGKEDTVIVVSMTTSIPNVNPSAVDGNQHQTYCAHASLKHIIETSYEQIVALLEAFDTEDSPCQPLDIMQIQDCANYSISNICLYTRTSKIPLSACPGVSSMPGIGVGVNHAWDTAYDVKPDIIGLLHYHPNVNRANIGDNTAPTHSLLFRIDFSDLIFESTTLSGPASLSDPSLVSVSLNMHILPSPVKLKLRVIPLTTSLSLYSVDDEGEMTSKSVYACANNCKLFHVGSDRGVLYVNDMREMFVFDMEEEEEEEEEESMEV